MNPDQEELIKLIKDMAKKEYKDRVMSDPSNNIKLKPMLSTIHRLSPDVDPKWDIALNPEYTDDEFRRDYKAVGGSDLPNLPPDVLQMVKEGFQKSISRDIIDRMGPSLPGISVPGEKWHNEMAPKREKPLLFKYQRPGTEVGRLT